MTAVGMEIRKIKRKHYWLMASGATALQLLWLAAMALKRSTGAAEARLMVLSLTEPLYLGLLLMPIVAALLASRLVTLDTEERMDQLFTAFRQRAVTRFTAKLVVGSVSIAAGESLFVGLLAAAGPGLGLRAGAGYQEALWPGLVVLLAASAATMAVQLALAACLERQAIGLGVAVVAGIVSSALPFMYLAPLGWALPWGLPAAANPVSTQLLGQTGMVTALVAHPWVNALGAGVSGFLLKDTRTADLHQALRAVAAGDAILTPRITRQLLERHMPRSTTPQQRAARQRLGLLAPREREVAGLVAQGMTNAEIGERLFIQPESVKKTVTRILAKLQLRDRVQLVIILRDAQSSR